METLTIALISDVFFGDGAKERLVSRLQEANVLGADLVVLPEIACNAWSPATRNKCDEDAEDLGGPRSEMQREAAKEVGIGLIGSAILNSSKERYNTCLFWDDQGVLLGTYQKHHIPDEKGFWERSHYSQGIEGFPLFNFRGWNIGIQICSDMNRPQGSHVLAAAGADVIVSPRSSELATYDKWRTVWIANALTTACYVCSVNRPAPENGVLIGGASIVVGPNGEVLAESCEAITVCTARQSTIQEARIEYPGYLACRSDLYAKEWQNVRNK